MQRPAMYRRCLCQTSEWRFKYEAHILVTVNQLIPGCHSPNEQAGLHAKRTKLSKFLAVAKASFHRTTSEERSVSWILWLNSMTTDGSNPPFSFALRWPWKGLRTLPPISLEYCWIPKWALETQWNGPLLSWQTPACFGQLLFMLESIVVLQVTLVCYPYTSTIFNETSHWKLRCCDYDSVWKNKGAWS